MDIREKILVDRENRMKLIREVFGKNNKFIISIKCNICGNDKNSSKYDFVRRYFLNLTRNNFEVYSCNYYESFDGDFFLVEINDVNEIEVKKKLIELEEGNFGRVIDLDLYTNTLKSITRDDLGFDKRKCIVCSGESSGCMRELKHSVEDVLAATTKIIKDDLVKIVVENVASAMIEEVSAEPKFGLVTKNTTGKHTDMDYTTFEKSVEALVPYFTKYAYEGFEINEDTFTNLRKIGLKAEEAMFKATNGVNTHKGSIFILGFIIPSVIDALYNKKEFTTISETISLLAKDIMLDFNHTSVNNTVGEEMYDKYKIAGVRGEVFEGLMKSFNAVSKFYDYGGSNNELVIDLLCYFMSMLDDTVILHNQDIGFLYYVKNTAEEIMDAGGVESALGRELIEKYTEEFIEHKISPGGSADMVIATLSLMKIK